MAGVPIFQLERKPPVLLRPTSVPPLTGSWALFLGPSNLWDCDIIGVWLHAFHGGKKGICFQKPWQERSRSLRAGRSGRPLSPHAPNTGTASPTSTPPRPGHSLPSQDSGERVIIWLAAEYSRLVERIELVPESSDPPRSMLYHPPPNPPHKQSGGGSELIYQQITTPKPQKHFYLLATTNTESN